MKTPRGFLFSGVHAGLKPVRKDFAVIASDVPAVAAGVFSTNLAASAPILDARPRVPASGIRAICVNSGNANALTGAAGLADVVTVRNAVASALGVSADAVLTASTGVIGAKLPVGKLVAAAPGAVAALAVVPEPAAEAIITTDTRIKLASRTIEIGGREVVLSAIAKGSGMIAPQLATVIAVITTDCAIAPAVLDRALRDAVDPSFHCLVVDGETSTNDTVYALANGVAGNPVIAEIATADYATFTAALTDLAIELARDIAADGEGATRRIDVNVTGAPDAATARDLARSIAQSSLVKASIFGADPNWGRILATVGARGATQHYPIDLQALSVHIQGTCVFAHGEPVSIDGAALRARMRAPEVAIELRMTQGSASATAWGCDLSYDYVKINADYTSMIVQTADGTLAKDDRLTNYSPSFKRTLLVEALSYIARFASTRCVVSYGDHAVHKAALVKSFCDDIGLLRSVGLQPIVVHSGGPDPRALDAINAELVTLLNLDGNHAMGMTGKDGGLLRGKAGEITSVNAAVLEMMLGQGFVPVISPIGLGDDGRPFPIDADPAAAAIAVALRVPKLIYVTDVPGLLDAGELVTDLVASELEGRLALDAGPAAISGGMVVKARSILSALRGGVGRVHIIDGRTPHSLIAELFTDRGVGTLVTP